MSISRDKGCEDMMLTESLKQIRKQYKMTQGDIAKLLGISRSGYTYYETGKTVPSIEILKKLSSIYNISIDDIVDNPPRNSADMRYYDDILTVSEGNADPLIYMKKEEQALIMAFRLLSEEEKEQLQAIAMEILNNKNDND
jgi:transcriptional regulator with XRE-family HTH domain